MNPGRAVWLGFRRSLDLTGRSSRAEYLPFLAVSVALLAMVTAIGAAFGHGLSAFGYAAAVLYLPVTSAGVRRLHDAGEPGSLMLAPLVPGLTALVLAGLLGLLPLNSLLFMAFLLGSGELILALAGLALTATVVATLVVWTDVMGRLLLPSRRDPGDTGQPRRPGWMRRFIATLLGLSFLPLPALAGLPAPVLADLRPCLDSGQGQPGVPGALPISACPIPAGSPMTPPTGARP